MCMGIYVYENFVHDYTKLHDGRCSYCNDGRGLHPDRTDENSVWHGPFDSFSAALAAARATGRPAKTCKGHKHCRALPEAES